MLVIDMLHMYFTSIEIDRARSGCKHSKSFKRVNMQNKHGGSIRSHDCYLKRCVKNSSTQYSFYVMESRVSRFLMAGVG